jgi:hypothetical protein
MSFTELFELGLIQWDGDVPLPLIEIIETESDD